MIKGACKQETGNMTGKGGLQRAMATARAASQPASQPSWLVVCGVLAFPVCLPATATATRMLLLRVGAWYLWLPLVSGGL